MAFFIFLTAGLLLLGRIGSSGSGIVYILIPGLLTAAGIAMSIVPSTIAATQGATPQQAGLASGLVNTSRQAGGGLGIALLISFATSYTSHLIGANKAGPDSLTSGFRPGYLIDASLALAAPLIAYSLLRSAGMGTVTALVLSGVFPALGVAAGVIQHRRLDVVGDRLSPRSQGWALAPSAPVARRSSEAHPQRPRAGGHQRIHARHQIHTRRHHRRRVNQCADRRGALHRVRQPDVERQLRRFAYRAREEQDADRGQDGFRPWVPRQVLDDRPEVHGSERGEYHQDADGVDRAGDREDGHGPPPVALNERAARFQRCEGGLVLQHLKVPSIMMGFGLPDDNLHAPNEKFHLPNFYKGIESVIHYFELLGK